MHTLQEQKDELLTWLKTALALELGTIPPYMMALLSLHPQANREAAMQIRAVMIEEMLHMTLVGNLINSLGGTVEIGPDSIPSYPLSLDFEGKRFKDRRFDLNLQAFSPELVNIFMQLELPRDWSGPTVHLKAVHELDIEGMTIGAFYDHIIAKLDALCAQFGEKDVFSGKPERQISQDYYWSSGGKPIAITNLATAQLAMKVIVDQGEGSCTSIYDGDKRTFGQPAELAHFFRFREIHFGRHYRVGDHPHKDPSGKPFEVDYTAVYPIKTNPTASDYAPGSALALANTRFNAHYTMMLVQLREAFNGTPKALYTAIMNGMHGMMPLAMEMVVQPIPGDAQGRNGGPTFEWVEG